MEDSTQMKEHIIQTSGNLYCFLRLSCLESCCLLAKNNMIEDMINSKSSMDTTEVNRQTQTHFWKFIHILKREQSLNHVNISQARAGHQIRIDCSISVDSPQHKHVRNTSSNCLALCHPKRDLFLKTYQVSKSF